ncbi:crossover junction endodeoxyribonuclease RuvC [Patescibacteria group bacterium]
MGIDPGLATTGFGIIEKRGSSIVAKAYGVIETPAKMPFPVRLNLIYKNAKKIISKWQPNIIAVEELFYHRNVTTAFTVGQARGVLLLCASQTKSQIVSCKPLQVKRALTGYGQASKPQIQKAVSAWLGLKKPPRPDDAADALAVAICGERLAVKIT